MAIEIYPSSLPTPQRSTVTPAERRAMSDSQRPREARALQRDRMEFEELVWPPMARDKCEEILEFWRVTLSYGGAWFLGTWPLPRGQVPAARKFIQQPRWEFVPGGMWRLSALCEVRGRGMTESLGGFFEPFDEGLAPYTVSSGPQGIFTIVEGDLAGPMLRIAEVTSQSSYRQRSFTIDGPVIGFGGSFKVTDLDEDDSCGIYLMNNTTGQRFGFAPRSAFSYEPGRRAVVDYQTGFQAIGSEALLADTWYRFYITLAAGEDEATCRITRISDGTLIVLQNLTGIHAPFLTDKLRFFTDAGGSTTTCVTFYDSVNVNPY